MRTSDAGLKDLMIEEGVRYVAYPDPASPRAVTGVGSGDPWTIGIGQTGPGIREGTVWSEAQVMEAFRESVKVREDYINASVKVPLTQGQFDALLSFSFNTSGPDGATFKRSTLLRKLNSGDYAGASAEFPKWCIPAILIPRRARERALFDGTEVTAQPHYATTADVQRILGIPADGVFGPTTKHTLINWQAEQGLTPDGIVGPRTLRAMGLI